MLFVIFHVWAMTKKGESVQSFENSAKNIISFVGIEIGHIRLQFCEDIHFYRKLKIEVGLEGPMDFKNEQSNPELWYFIFINWIPTSCKSKLFSGEKANSSLVKIYIENLSHAWWKGISTIQCVTYHAPTNELQNQKMYTCNVCHLNSLCFILHTSE